MKFNQIPSFKKVGYALALSLSFVSASSMADDSKTLKFFNWSDYIGENTISKFEAETGIKVISDVFDSNEVLEAKLLAGGSGYDLVVPTSSFMARQIVAGVFQPLDKTKLDNYKNLDGELLSFLQRNDPGNQYGVPYLWGTTGIGYNVKQVEAILGKDAPVDSWDLIFKPENIEKLSKCGVMFLDSPDELMPLALNYVNADPSSKNASDYKSNSAAVSMLKSVRPFITQFHSSQYINNLANGDVCVAIGWSGDVIQAQDRAEEAGNGVEIAYSIPKEGTSIWFDMLAIPADAKNADNAHTFINFLLRPEIIAEISDYVAYANPNTASLPFQDKELTSNTGIYPSDEVKKKLFPSEMHERKIEKLMTRMWRDLKTSR